MKISSKAPALAFVGLLTLLTAQPAWAACGDTLAKKPASRNIQNYSGHSDDLFQKSAWAGANSHAIVGMWAFKFQAGGQLIDFGYAQWHDDGTEIMNSGGRAPATENFCLGVWEQTGPSRFHLNHFALSYNASTGQIDARVNIKEDVTVDPSGATYSGTFTIDVYDPTGTTLLAHAASGQVTGQRVAAN